MATVSQDLACDRFIIRKWRQAVGAWRVDQKVWLFVECDDAFRECHGRAGVIGDVLT